MPEIAKGFKIPLNDLEWVAAFHNKKNNPHCHLVVWNKNQEMEVRRKPYINFTDIKRAVAKGVYKEELKSMYEMKDVSKEMLSSKSKEEIDNYKEELKKLYQNEDLLIKAVETERTQEFVNKAIFAFFIIVGVTAISSYAVNRFDGLTVIQTKTYNGNCVLLIEDKKAMSVIEGDFYTAPENAVYGICNSLADHGIYQLEKVVIHSDDKNFIEMLGSNIEVGEWYVNEKCEIEFCENAISTDYLATRVNRGESSFLIMGKYDNKNTYEDADADILIFANKCPDVDFMIDRNIKLAISGRIKGTITNRKYMNFLERFFQNNIYTVEECGTIEVRTTGNGEYDIKTERNNYAHK